jgi:hypothetical protein
MNRRRSCLTTCNVISAAAHPSGFGLVSSTGWLAASFGSVGPSGDLTGWGGGHCIHKCPGLQITTTSMWRQIPSTIFQWPQFLARICLFLPAFRRRWRLTPTLFVRRFWGNLNCGLIWSFHLLAFSHFLFSCHCFFTLIYLFLNLWLCICKRVISCISVHAYFIPLYYLSPHVICFFWPAVVIPL